MKYQNANDLTIDQIEAGMNFIDTEHNDTCRISDKTSTSVEVQHYRLSDKGIDCKNWYTLENFQKRFKQ